MAIYSTVTIILASVDIIGLADLYIDYNPILPSEAIGVADLYIDYNPILPSEAIGLAKLTG